MQDNKKVLQVMLGRHNATAPMSSYSRVELDVKTQSYFFVHSVRTLEVTATARGITEKQILVGSVGDQVCSPPLLPPSTFSSLLSVLLFWVMTGSCSLALC